MTIDELETPVLLIDLDTMEANLRRMSDYSRQHGLDFRPHIKTHRIPEIAKMQVELGAIGITVAKLGEAEVMSEAGLDDLLLAYPLLGASKARRLRGVLEKARVSVALDSEESVRWVAKGADGKSVEVLVEIDLGSRRCGVAPGPEAIRLARLIESTAGLHFGGLMFYPGHIHPEFDGNKDTLEQLRRDLRYQLECFEREKIPIPRISGGSTPSAPFSHEIENLTEIRPGTYVFNDRNTLEWKACREVDCAASLLVTVASNAVPGQVIIDGGAKAFTSDLLAPGTKAGHGLVKGYPEIVFEKMNEEHGFLRLPEGLRFDVGEQLQIVPNHICVAVNLQDSLVTCRGREVVGEWEIKARGKSR